MQQYMTLKELLYKIKIEGDISYLHELLKNEQVKGIITSIVKKYKYNSKDVKNIVESFIQDFTLKYYEYMDDYTEERYINFIRKYLGRKVREVIFKFYPQEEISFGDIINFEDLDENYLQNDFSDKLIKKIDLENAIKKLDEREKFVIQKYRFEGYSQKEIAEQLNITQSTVCKIDKKALKKLKKLLEME